MPDINITLNLSDRQAFILEHLRALRIGSDDETPLSRDAFALYVVGSWLDKKWSMLRNQVEQTMTDEDVQASLEG